MTTAILAVTAVAYVPFWDVRGYIPSKVRYFISTYHPMYYTRCKVLFEGDSLPAGSTGTSAGAGAGAGADSTSTTSASTSTSTSTSTKTFYAVHPHGAFCLGWSVLFASNIMEKVRFCFSPALYHSPFFKVFSMTVGNPGKADKASMISYMKRGEDLALPPGGFEEATLTSMNHDRAYIKKRAGFVKLCLQYGYSIVPVYCFGENETFWNMQGFWNARLKLNSFGVPAIVIWGSKLLPILPKRNKNGLLVVAGERLVLPRIENPTREDVKKWHDKYMAALLKIYDDHKFEAYGDDAKAMKLDLW